MASERNFKVTGEQPVVVDGETHYPGDEFKADPDAVAFLEGVGSIEASRSASGGDSKKD